MPQDSFQYDKMIERALRGVVRERFGAGGARRAARRPSKFLRRLCDAQEPGVQLPASLLGRFPEEMTIVLQHQFYRT